MSLKIYVGCRLMKHTVFEIYFFRKICNFHDKHEKLTHKNCCIVQTHPNLFS
jgi:hypothetical protein